MSQVFIALIQGVPVRDLADAGQRCKYYPSCSNYAVGALRVHGAVRGLGLASWRLLRCNPFSNGGYDLCRHAATAPTTATRSGAHV